MRRLLALGALAAGLAYFFHPALGVERRRRARAWLADRLDFPAQPAPGEHLPPPTVIWREPPTASEAPPAPTDAPAEPPIPAAAAGPLAEAADAQPATATTEAEAVEPALPAAAIEETDEGSGWEAVPRPEPVTAATIVPELAPEPATGSISEWLEREAERDAEGTPDRRPSRAIMSAAVVTAVASAALAAGLVTWTLWPSDSSGTETAALDETRALADDQARAIAVLSQPTKRVSVLGEKGRLVLVLTPKGQAALIVSDIQRAPARKTYQAWVIVGKKPNPAGLFVGGREHVVIPLTRRVPKGAIVAVTLEPAGGVPSPTTTPLFAAKRS